MKIKQFKITNLEECQIIDAEKADWVLCFGAKALLENREIISTLLDKFMGAEIAFCSTAGEICQKCGVGNDTMVITSIKFQHTKLKSTIVNIQNFANSYDAGKSIAETLNDKSLKHIFILSDGSNVNGSELVKSMNEYFKSNVVITGGMAGDDTRFDYTLTSLNDFPSRGNIMAFGLYGDKIKIAHGSMGGWDSFGLAKTVTKSVGNELFEIDGRNALELYKEHLGKYSDDLPGAALLFPLAVKMNESGDVVVRTILSINNEKNSMIFAGDVPEGSKVRFMLANFDRLIDAAGTAAKSSLISIANAKPQLAILISCVGRKIVLGGRVDEEVGAVIDVLGGDIPITGFYSYGEISPLKEGTSCQLHNQTMTITCFQEVD
jgi:hypothetical protein